eukprot:3179319-Pyramimonas_sp.AAC.1
MLRSDALIKASATDALDCIDICRRISPGNFHLSLLLEGNSFKSWRRAVLQVIVGSSVEG